MSNSSKHKILNYWPANILDLFSKIYKCEIQDKRIYFSIKRFFLFFFSLQAMDSSNGFYFISRDLVIGKLVTYSLSSSDLKLKLSYLRNYLENNLWCTARFHSWTRPFPFAEEAAIHNYADESSLSAWTQNFSDLIPVLITDLTTEGTNSYNPLHQ